MGSTNQADPSRYYFRIYHYWWNDLGFIYFLSPWFSAAPQKPQTFTASKSKYENPGQKFKFLIKFFLFAYAND